MSIEEIPFRISTGLKDIIGKELITDDDIAIFELVKNSYDAYANKVTIIFKNLTKTVGSKDSKIIILDDGHGMSRDDIEQKWLFVGFSEKKIVEGDKRSDYRDKIKAKRRIFAGAKGIGRFSSDRLGRFLTIYTKKQEEEGIHKLDIDWKLFEGNQDSDFQTIMTTYTTVNKLPQEIDHVGSFKHGTILEISSLRERWDRDKLLQLKRYLQRLINPSQDQQNIDFTIEMQADEFKREDGKKKEDYEKVNGPIRNFVFEKLGIKTAQITCEIKDGAIKTKLIDKGDLVVEFEEENKYHLLNNITINLFYLNSAAKTAFSRIMGIQPVRYGSVFLYRNGFRVYSYGDEGNDWLGLEKRKAQGYARFLSAREMMGRIELHGIQPEFKELSSRSEGLVKTPAYHQLTEFFIKRVLRRFERYVVEGLSWDVEGQSPEKLQENSADVVLKIIGKEGLKNIHFGKNLLHILREKEAQQIPEIIKNFEILKKYVKSKKERKYIEKQFKVLKSTTRTLTHQRDEYKQKYEIKARESLFLEKAISSDKDQILNLIHSIKISAQAIEDGLYKINKRIKEGASVDSITQFLDKIHIENQKIHRISKIVSNANFDLLANTIKTDLVQYVCQYLEIGSDKTVYSIDIKLVNEDIIFETEFQPIEVSVMFDNFISNSSKAEASTLIVKFEKIGRELRILIGDNGKGISANDQRFLFTRGFTTTKSGTGLGLYYNRSMIESMGGSIRFLGNNVPEMGRGACFEVIKR